MRRFIVLVILSASLAAHAQEDGSSTNDLTARLSEDVASNAARMDEKMSSVEQRLNALEKKNAELSKKLGSGLTSTSIDQRLKDLDRRLSKIERDLDQLKGRVSKVESKK